MHLSPRHVSSLQEIRVRRGRNGRRRTKPRKEKIGTCFPTPGATMQPQLLSPGQSQGLWDRGSGPPARRPSLALLSSLHCCRVQSVLKGRLSVLQTDPQKTVLPGCPKQPHQQNIPRKRSPLPAGPGSCPGAKGDKDALFYISQRLFPPAVTITRLGGEQAWPGSRTCDGQSPKREAGTIPATKNLQFRQFSDLRRAGEDCARWLL